MAESILTKMLELPGGMLHNVKALIPGNDVDVDFNNTETFLGSGGFGKVHKGKYRGIGGDTVAVKQIIITPAYDIRYDEKDIQALAKELKMMFRTKHQRVVGVYGMILDDVNKSGIVMEYMAHGNIKNFLKKHKPVPFEVKFKMMIDVATGLSFIVNNCNVAHKDIKPDNIFIDQHLVAKIGDFGISRIMQTTNPRSQTLQRTACSAVYAAPEILPMGAKATEKTDVFSFGITQFEVTENRGLYDDLEDFFQIIVERSTVEKPPFHDTDIKSMDCPDFYKRIICHCVEYKSDERPNFGEIRQKMQVEWESRYQSSWGLRYAELLHRIHSVCSVTTVFLFLKFGFYTGKSAH